ncbi:glycoside hydrolase family 38 C-terminal domain-containing protein [Lysinibacter sp. HNR]|uniref:alpha-mannosidase n=1 Tax=Lysinibacter sp. HNR TaxID=3031408 RepID=UPI002435C90B|nr:glycoside hydrolase family 38 C-terminal domain-containing protein [Lysinibacter sp. HNR]WGD38189.1 glycoside hydrolase family 38 C-terminal domain-containing protein [Lysinibacter sp. HNR]
MHDDSRFIKDRLFRALRERLVADIHRPITDLTLTAWHVEGGQGEPVEPDIALRQNYQPIAVGDAWGPAWGTTWFRLTGTIPPEHRDKPLEVIFNPGFSDHTPGFHAEGLVYLPGGNVVKGLNPRNQWIPVNAETAPGGAFEVYVEAAANPLLQRLDGLMIATPLGEKFTAGTQPLYRIERADINLYDQELWELRNDLEVLGQLSAELSEGDPRKYEILRAIERSLDRIDLQDVNNSAPAARAELIEVLGRKASESAHTISAIGHAHIDSAWLWPIRETVRKVGRTTSNVVNLLDQYPEFRFAMSQSQQLAWLENHRPDVFARVRKHAEEGRFIPVGGMWVESDTNMPGSEALARQFTYGKNYLRETFGIETETVWLPDSFGYSAALPQLIKLSGSRWFLTQKISWSQTNKFPHHTFWWEGIDGTRIFTHFPPIDTYNAELSGEQLAHATRNYRDKGLGTRSLAPFGWGDGGGGPTREMLARAKRTANLEGSPRVVIESPNDFFSAAENENPAAPTWSGELYLEYHRGVYTSQLKNKQGNRRSEHLLRETELWCSTAAIQRGFPYPYETLDRIWKEVLLLQFHDILPGTSIAWVHREAAESYEKIAAELLNLITEAQQTLAGPPSGGQTIVFNAAPHQRAGVPALGAVLRDNTSPAQDTVRPHGDGFLLENPQLSVEIDGRGLITRIRDHRHNREVLASDRPANVLHLHQDFPNMWDAWDIEHFYRNTVTELVSVDSLEKISPDEIRVRRSFGSSTVEQVITLRYDSSRVDIRTTVDWHETEKLLKAEFPLNVHADRSASEVQYGHVFRPTHSNTSWDAAKFEICAHRWVQVAEPGYGVAIANDSTYGHDIARSSDATGRTTTTVRLSLMRAPQFPDPHTDQGTHTLSFSIVPGVDVIGAAQAGYELNLPQRVIEGSSPVDPLVTVSDDRVIVEAIKLADDQSGDLVVRLYEASGASVETTITSHFVTNGVVETDLLERPLPADALVQDTGGGTIVGNGDTDNSNTQVLRLRPFQIVTLRYSNPASKK